MNDKEFAAVLTQIAVDLTVVLAGVVYIVLAAQIVITIWDLSNRALYYIGVDELIINLGGGQWVMIFANVLVVLCIIALCLFAIALWVKSAKRRVLQ